MVVVADGTARADRCLERVLTCDPGMGVIRHADAGYDAAIACANERGVVIPRLRDSAARDRDGCRDTDGDKERP
jgi:urocanate hydratase